MTDPFAAHLDHLLHKAREEIGRIDEATAHVNALSERYQHLRDAIDGCSGCRSEVEARLRGILGRPNYDEPAVVYSDRMRVA